MANPTQVHGLDGLRSLMGQELGPTSPMTIEQSAVQAFADATGDHQWIHIDPARAASESPYGGTIAHGYYVLSLLPRLLLHELIELDGVSAILNYGVDKLRFPDAARVGAELTMRATLSNMEPKGPGQLATFAATFEATGSKKPCCVVQALLMVLG